MNSSTIPVIAWSQMSDTGQTSPLVLTEGERYLVYATYNEDNRMLYTSEGECRPDLFHISDGYQEFQARLRTIAKIVSAKNFSPEIISKLAPNKQIAWNEILPWEVECKIGHDLIFKVKDGSPVCVKPETAKKLIERGFARATFVP